MDELRLNSDVTPDLRIDKVRAIMLEDLRLYFFSVNIQITDHLNTVSIYCHPRQGHGENLPDLEGKGNSMQEAIEDTWTKWRK